jgi:biopolymer transport protein TolQ
MDVMSATLVTLQAEAVGPPPSLDPVQLILDASLVVKLVLVLLVMMSVGSWFIVGAKWVRFAQAARQSADFLAQFHHRGPESGWAAEVLEALYGEVKRYPASPVAQVFHAGYVELARMSADVGRADVANVERAVRRASTVELTRLESWLVFLATTGSTAPFIGLFGTVWGIMNSFLGIGAQQNASLDVVAPGIAEALIATAVGLAAAIPAVVAYNLFVRRVRLAESEVEAFGQDFVNVIKRHYL